MKTLCMFAFAMIISFAGFSQIKQGQSMITGSFNLDFGSINIKDNPEKATSTSFGINPMYGYFIKDNWAIGSGIGYSNYSTKSTDSQSDITNKNSRGMFFIDPFVKYYHPCSEHFYLYGRGDINVGFGTIKNKTESGGTTTTTKSKTSGLTVSIGPGFTYFLNDHFGLELGYGSLSYSYTSSKPEEGEKTNFSNFGLNLSLNSLAFGLTYFFDCGK